MNFILYICSYPYYFSEYQAIVEFKMRWIHYVFKGLYYPTFTLHIGVDQGGIIFVLRGYLVMQDILPDIALMKIDD